MSRPGVEPQIGTDLAGRLLLCFSACMRIPLGKARGETVHMYRTVFRRRLFRWSAAVALLLVTATHATAAVLYVDANNSSPSPPYASWATAATRIQDAVDAASPGDEVVVTNGTYASGGVAVYGTATNRVAVTKPLNVHTANGPASATIAGDIPGGIRCVYLTNGASISGFILTGGGTISSIVISNDYNYQENGGGLWCAGSDSRASNCVIVGCWAYNTGGGVFGGTLYNCSLANNSASQGGGASGSVLYNCGLNGNTASIGGGGVYQGTLSNCVVTTNSASEGGGIAFSTATDCTFWGNTANTGGGIDGGNAGSCIFIGNRANYFGGGGAACTLQNCTLYGNFAQQGGGGASGIDFGGYTAVCTIFNSILVSNICVGTPNFNSTNCTLNSCCTAPLPSSGSNNITANPLFVDQFNLNFRLQSNSPCIDAGNGLFVPSGPDLDGNPRVVGASIDIGAYEFQGLPAPVAPYITVQPTNQSVFVGSNVTFVVFASGTTPLTYQWRFNGTNLAGANGNVFLLANAQLTNSGSYSVAVSNSVGFVISSNAVLTVNTTAQIAPFITGQPTNQTAVVGSNAMFTVLAGGTSPLRFQWRFNGSDISGGTTNPLRLVNVQLTNAGTYSVFITNTYGTITSSNATLTVNTSSVTPPFITGQPTNRTVGVGANVSFVVTAGGTAPLKYQWLFNGTNVPNGTTNGLAINNVQLTNAGSYWVVVTNSAGRATSSIATLTVTQATPTAPFFITQPSSQSVYVGDNVMFNSSAGGTFPLAYQWSFNGTNVTGATNNSLSLSNVQFVAAGNYAVTVSNAYGSITSTNAQLKVNARPPPGTRFVNVNNATPSSPYTNWASAAQSIQEAVDVAQPGDQIIVSNGVYGAGGRDIYGQTNRVAVDKPLSISSVNGPLYTIIQGFYVPGSTNWSQFIRCVYLTNGASLSGFTLTNGASGGGGGVWCEWGGGNITNCVIVGNATSGSGGGAFQGMLYNCTLSNNSAAYGGGGGYFSKMTSCVVVGNWTANQGGGVSECALTNCLVIGNSATNYGGGAWGGTLCNCTVVGNSANHGGGGAGTDSFHIHDFCLVLNSIVCYNTAVSATNCDCTQYDSCLPDNGYGSGNIPGPPLFVDLAGGNLRLQSNSPCINTGDNTFTSASVDIDGRPRVVGGTVDMGAYEFQPGANGSYIAWLQQTGQATDGSADYADPDGDGMNNWQEWRTGTDPNDAASVLRLLIPSRSEGGISLTWQSVNGINYFVERGTNMGTSPLLFERLATGVPGQSGTTSFVDTNAPASPLLFYRVGVGP